MHKTWRSFCPIISLLVITACKTHDTNEKKEVKSSAQLIHYVDPLIGSGFHGHVFVGANVPFGAVQIGPTQLAEGWDWCSGYHYSDSVIIGFSHTHLSGTGIGDLGDILVMPTTGNLRVWKGQRENLANGYSSVFSHKDETVTPGFYEVNLKRYDIKVELTATERVAFHRYTFPRKEPAHIIFDLKEGIGWDNAIQTHLEQINDTTLFGYRYSKGWADDQRIFFAAVFSKPIESFAIYEDSVAAAGATLTGKMLKGIVNFGVQPGEKLMIKVGISPVSSANALMNIQKEISNWNFAGVKAQAETAWNEELGKVEVNTMDERRKRIFYTALYHTMIAPSIFNDVNGDYRGSDKMVYHSTFTNLTTFSLWDTYRSAHSLFTILQSQKVDDMINSMLRIYQQQGKLPVWHLMGNETNTMPGNSAFPVIADAYLKGFNGFDETLALDAMKASALRNDRGLKFIKERGFIPAVQEVESVAKGLEYSIDDWCAAQVAKKLGRQEEYEFFSKRAKNFRYYFDPETRFVRGRMSDDEWRTPFSPFAARHMKDDFSEGNAWQYTWLVPHDVEELIDLLGGEKKFIEKLDSLFVAQGDMGAEASSDITGLIGQYAHGNEPSHHITYLYGYVGQPWKTAEKVRYILDSLYTDKPDGICGNEDVGQMSSWYIFSSIGFYPVNPANGKYVIGSPIFDKVTLHLPRGKAFTITTKNNSAENIYIQEITLNGNKYNKAFITYRDIMNGGDMVIIMGNKPGSGWGIEKSDRATSEVVY
jgi:predicted alpha-1,2-mannosidase